MTELNERLEAVTDVDGQRVIRGVYRSDQIYSGNATGLAPDLIVGYHRGYRASWATCLGDLTEEVLARQRLGLERRPLRRCARSARRALLQPPIAGVPTGWSTFPSILAEFGCPRRHR